MMDSPINEQQLQEASVEGEKRAANALSILAKREVSVKTTGVKTIDQQSASQTLNKVQGHAVIVYTDVISGFAGTCLLSMERQDALNLVDLFNNRPENSTVVMQEIDRSTIKETLNILSNAYITELARKLGMTVMLSVPKLATKEKLEEVAAFENQAGGSVVLFETSLTVAGVDFKLELFFFFLIK